MNHWTFFSIPQNYFCTVTKFIEKFIESTNFIVINCIILIFYTSGRALVSGWGDFQLFFIYPILSLWTLLEFWHSIVEATTKWLLQKTKPTTSAEKKEGDFKMSWKREVRENTTNTVVAAVTESILFQFKKPRRLSKTTGKMFLKLRCKTVATLTLTISTPVSSYTAPQKKSHFCQPYFVGTLLFCLNQKNQTKREQSMEYSEIFGQTAYYTVMLRFNIGVEESIRL